jgi:hypothetical protein
MIAKTDYIVGGCLILFFILGWRKGLIKTLLDPLCLALGLTLSFLVYQMTQDVFKAIVVTIVSPFLLKVLVTFLLKTFQKKDQKPSSPAFLGSLLAGTLNVAWCSILLFLTLIILGKIHSPWNWGKKIQDDIHKARTYQILTDSLEKKS